MTIRALERALGPTVIAPTTYILYQDDFTGTTGAAPKAAWFKAQGTNAYPTAPVTIQSNTMRIFSGSTAAWSGGGSIFLGNPAKPEGDSANGVPAIVSNCEYTFDYTLLNLSEQYPTIALRGRSADLWPSGGGQNTFKTGYSIVLSPAASQIEVQTNYNSTTIVTIPFTFPSNALKFRIKLDHGMLYIRIWAAANAEPSTWTYSGNIINDESDGSIGFSIFNGPAAEQKTVTIDNFLAVAPILSLGATQQAPASDPTGFTRIFTENFDTPAVAGSGAGNFLDTYSNSFQPYSESSPAYQQRAMLSAHDGVMDWQMDGARGAAGMFGTPTNAFNRVGGRFAARIKALNAFSNGPAWMLWPVSDIWADGEIDFPESVSGAGGTAGFQDAPWIHHHKMVAGQEGQAQDVPLLVSWREWHVYAVEWYPPNSGKGPQPTSGVVIYYVDGVEIYRTTTDVPTTAHRFTAQTGYWGTAGNMYVDWVTMSSLT